MKKILAFAIATMITSICYAEQIAFCVSNNNAGTNNVYCHNMTNKTNINVDSVGSMSLGGWKLVNVTVTNRHNGIASKTAFYFKK